MIKTKGNYTLENRKKMRGGEGEVKIEKLWEPGSELKAKTRLFARLIIEPGSSIGFHKHENEEEVFYILKGTAEINDNGDIFILNEGDSSLTGAGRGHSIKALGNETLEVLAVISEYSKN
ncbi:MAG TPA: cupin domain-containing protein [Victivallales bacterium]|nr:cupin domain-containing protein [Victivallales bacterium]HPO89950.1 cupin domain-containing protein [Victivallales bacterium]